MKVICEKGSPADYSGRQEKEQKCYHLLDELGIEYSRCDHEHADTMDACAEIEKVLGAEICKNLFLTNRQHTRFYLLMMPGSKPFKTKELSGQLGCARLSFAGAEEMGRYLNISPGSVSVLGLMNDAQNHVQLLVDQDLLRQDYIGCHPCINSSTLKLKREDIFGPLLRSMKHEAVMVTLTGMDI